MRIVLSNSSSQWGGVHKVTEILARGFLERGHDVIVFGLRGGMLEERMRGVAPFAPIIGGVDFNPAALWRAYPAIGKHRSDVVLALMKKDMTMTALSAVARGVPVVMRHANQRPLGRNFYWKKLYGDLPALHITNAEATKQTLLESSPWLLADRVEVIYNGIDPSPYERARAAGIGVPEGGLAVGFVGSFTARKGVRELSRAWHRVADEIPNAHLVIVGKGGLEEEMRTLLGIAPRVHWLGYRTDVPEILHALDVLVLPSYVEGAPNVVLEAMCAGVPIVATAVSGTPELVRDRIEALLVRPRSEADLAASLIEALSKPDLRRGMADAAKCRVTEKFGLSTMIDAYEEALGRVAG
jgi:glycosyltransferase involved in cell wall biosynthesis